MSEKYKLVEFKEGDTSFYVETVIPEGDSGSRRQAGAAGSAGKAAIEAAKESFEQTMACLKPIAQGVLRSLEEINNPEEIEITFGVKVGVEGKLVVAAMSGEANFSVKLTWKNGG